MGRMYSVVVSNVAATTAVDFLELIGATGKILKIHELRISQSTENGDAQSEQLRVTLKRFTSSYTSGSAGSTPTPRRFDPGDAAPTFTVKSMNTTRCTGGNSETLIEDCFNVLGPGWQFLPTPECRTVVGPSSALVLGLESTPADSISFTVFAMIEEIG